MLWTAAITLTALWFLAIFNAWGPSIAAHAFLIAAAAVTFVQLIHGRRVLALERSLSHRSFP